MASRNGFSSNRTIDGLVYREYKYDSARNTPYQWANASRLADGYFVNFRNRIPGAATLKEMALRSVVRHRRFFNGDELKHVDWEPIGKLMWETTVAM